MLSDAQHEYKQLLHPVAYSPSRQQLVSVDEQRLTLLKTLGLEKTLAETRVGIRLSGMVLRIVVGS
jgi:hypothetical protein